MFIVKWTMNVKDQETALFLILRGQGRSCTLGKVDSIRNKI